METKQTKAAAEAALRELPSVLGAFVREDIHGDPREIHLLVGPEPDPRDLAHDVRDLLEERLGVKIDRRIISIAQLVRPLAAAQSATTRFAAAASTAAAPADGLARTDGRTGMDASATRDGGHGATSSTSGAVGRLVFDGIESRTANGEVWVRVRLASGGEVWEGEAVSVDGESARIRAGADAALAAVERACGGETRFRSEAASGLRVLGGEYAVVVVLAAGPVLGRAPMTLYGAQPVTIHAEDAGALAALRAIDRILERVLSPPRSAG